MSNPMADELKFGFQAEMEKAFKRRLAEKAAEAEAEGAFARFVAARNYRATRRWHDAYYRRLAEARRDDTPQERQAS